MGIKGLPKLIRDVAGSCAVKSYKFSRFKGMTIAVDASLIIHQTVIAMRSTGRDMKNNQGELTSHLHGLFYKILIFLQNEMVPIFVFDGKAPNIKNKTLKKRLLRKAEAEKHLAEISDSEDEEYIKHFKQTFKPSKDNIKEAMILLDLMGIPYIVAPGEADVVCAWLAARYNAEGQRYVKGVCSDDSDILVFGANYLFKDMLRFMNRDKQVQVISLHKALVRMNLTMEQFVDMSVLMGCDYCENLRGIGPKTAYRLIRKHGGLEEALKYLQENKMDSDSDTSNQTEEEDEKMVTLQENIECMIVARNYFLKGLSSIDESDEFVLTDDNLFLRQAQTKALLDFMCVKHNFDVTRIKTGIDRLETYYRKMNITRPNTKQVHQISSDHIAQTLSEEIDFISSEEENMVVIPSKKNSKKM